MSSPELTIDPMYQRLADHYGHAIEIAQYGGPHGPNMSIECMECYEVIVDFDRYRCS